MKKIILCIVLIFFNLRYFSSAAEEGGLLLPVQDIAALHSRMEQNPSVDFLYSFFETTHLLDRYIKGISTVSRTPDYVLLFNGVDQADEWAIFDMKTKKRVDTILREGVLMTLTLDDNPNDHYAMELKVYPPFSKNYTLGDRITSLFTGNSNTTQFLSNEPIPNIPHYYVHAEYFKLMFNCTVEPEIIPLPGERFIRDYIGLGLSVGLSSREEPKFIFYDNIAFSDNPTNTEVFSGAALACNLFLGRDPKWHYTEMFWESRFYKRFWSRLSLQSGIVFTRSRNFFGHYIAGIGIRVFRRTDLVFGTMLTTQPKVNVTADVPLDDRWRADQVFPSERIALPYLGITLNMLEF